MERRAEPNWAGRIWPALPCPPRLASPSILLSCSALPCSGRSSLSAAEPAASFAFSLHTLCIPKSEPYSLFKRRNFWYAGNSYSCRFSVLFWIFFRFCGLLPETWIISHPQNRYSCSFLDITFRRSLDASTKIPKSLRSTGNEALRFSAYKYKVFSKTGLSRRIHMRSKCKAMAIQMQWSGGSKREKWPSLDYRFLLCRTFRLSWDYFFLDRSKSTFWKLWKTFSKPFLPSPNLSNTTTIPPETRAILDSTTPPTL